MVLTRPDGRTSHHVFADLPELLGRGDLLVINDTRVIPAKFTCRRVTGGKVEGLFLRQLEPGRWEVMLKGAGRCRAGERLAVVSAEDVRLQLTEALDEGRWLVTMEPPESAGQLLQRIGRTPLPPYIRRPAPAADVEDQQRYQTIYASQPGAVAAPTAGLHFSKTVFDGLTRRGIETASLTLHVGPGTFAPVKQEDLADHRMHGEWYELPGETAQKVNAARRAGRRVVAVGSTSLRVLEAVARQALGGELRPASGWTDLFIYPPAEFRVVDAMITNFHLPRSTLLMLVAAFCSPGKTDGLGMILTAYAEARKRRYRFYSYGDAMLIQ